MLTNLLLLAALAAPQYVEAPTFFSQEPGINLYSVDRYDAAIDSLKAQFDDLCGDTFCEGEFGNLTTLGIDCSIDVASASVGACVWTIAGSYTDIDPATGRIKVTHAVKACDFGFTGDAATLVRFLDDATAEGGFGQGLRTVPVPGRADGATLYQVLGSCL